MIKMYPNNARDPSEPASSGGLEGSSFDLGLGDPHRFHVRLSL